MNNERDQEIKNEIKDSTFVENYEGRVSTELGAEVPEVSFEQNKVEKKENTKVDEGTNREKKDPVLNEKKGLGYKIDDLDENVDQGSDYSSSNTWRKVLKEKNEL